MFKCRQPINLYCSDIPQRSVERPQRYYIDPIEKLYRRGRDEQVQNSTHEVVVISQYVTLQEYYVKPQAFQPIIDSIDFVIWPTISIIMYIS
jgi:hypothetical protein